MEVEVFHPDQIDVVGNRRPIDPAKVSELAESIKRFGLLNPISVRVINDGEALHLVAGAHRLAAVRQLGMEAIDCILHEFDDIDAELVEISENLHRAELTRLERDEQIARWVELTEAKAGQVDHVCKGGRGNEGGISAASRELGLERKDTERAVKVASITEQAKEAARRAGLDNNRSALLEVARAAPEAQESVVQNIVQAKATRTIMSDDEKRQKWLDSLLKAWEAADVHTRETFLGMVDAPVMGKRWG